MYILLLFKGMQGAANASILAAKISSEMATMLEALKIEMAMKLDAAKKSYEVLQKQINTNTEELKREIHVVGDDVKMEVLNVKDLVISLDSKIEVLKEVQLNLGFALRQATLDWKIDHLELKTNLSVLGESLSKEFAGLEKIRGGSLDGMPSLSDEDMQR
jgi:hypothetical protein